MPTKPRRRPAPNPVDYVDSPKAPNIFADECSGYFVHHGTVRLTLTSLTVSHSPEPRPIQRVVVGRLVMPVAGIKALGELINEFVTKLESGEASSAYHGPGTTTVQ